MALSTSLTKIQSQSIESGGNLSLDNASFDDGIVVSGISTLSTVKISSGIVTAITGIITYYGDGSKLSNVISGVGIQSAGTSVGTGITQLNFIGAGNTFNVVDGRVDISISSGGGSIGIQSSGTTVGTGITQLNFIGLGNTFLVSNSTATISIPGSRSITIGLREGSPISFPLTTNSFDVVSRTGFTTINITS